MSENTLTYELTQRLKSDISSGVYKMGDKLPSENNLCKQFGVSRSTVRGVLSNLQAIGLISSHFGKGSFVKQIEAGNSMMGLIPSVLLNQEKSLLELVEFRCLVEGEICHNACLKSTPKDIENLELLFEKMKESEKDENFEDFCKYDLAFHVAIANMTNNSFVIRVYEIIYEVFSKTVELILRERGREVGIYYHDKILKAFKDKDPENAKKIMDKHMSNLTKKEIEEI